MNKTVSSVLIIYLLTGIILMPKNCMSAAYDGINLCINVVIPSLFPFFVCSKILINNGFAELISKPLRCVMRPIFNVPGCGAFAFIIGILSGCPVGAKTVTDMYSNSLCTKAEAQRMLCFCNNSGPLFVVGSVAVGMLGYKEIGGILYASHILSAVFVGLIMSRYKTKEVLTSSSCIRHKKGTNYLSQAMTESVSLMGYVCGFVIFFAVAIAIFKQSGVAEILTYRHAFGDTVCGIMYGMLEMTNGISFLAQEKITAELLCAVSFVLGFGGLSVILQVAGIISEYGLSTAMFAGMKFVQGLISAVVTYIIVAYSQIPMPVFSYGEKISSLNYWANSINVFVVFGIIILFLSILSAVCKFLRRM